MATTDQITLLINAEVNKAVANLGKVNKSLATVDKQVKKTSKTSQLLNSSFLKMAFSAATLTAAYKTVIQPAIELEESQSRFATLFREGIDVANEWADTLVDSYAMSRQEAFDSLSAFQSMLKPLDMSAEAAGNMSNRFAKLAADLGSFNNVPTADVVRDLRSALAGSSETVEKYGSNIKIAELQQFALANGIIKTKDELRGAAKAQAILAKVISDTTDAQGDMLRTSGSMANILKRVKARIKDSAAAMGQEMLPGLKDLAVAFGEAFDKGSNLNSIFRRIGQTVSGLASGLAGFISLVGMVGIAYERLGSDMSQSEFEAKIEEKFNKAGDAFGNMVNSFNKALSDAPIEEEFLLIDGKLEKVTSNYQTATTEIGNIRKTASEKAIKEAQDARVKFEEMRRSDFENKMAKIQEEHQRIVEAKVLNDEELLELDRETESRKWEARMELAAESMQKIADASLQFTSLLQTSFDIDQKTREKKLDKEYQRKKKRILTEIKDEAEQKKALEKLDAEFEEKKNKLRREGAKKQKAIAIANATINTALAVTNALNSQPFLPMGPIMAALALATGIAQVALIASTPIPAAQEGGVLPGTTAGTLIRAGENQAAEAILPLENEEAQEKIGEALGGSAGGATTINMNINNLYATEEIPESMAIAIDQALLDLKQQGNSAFAESVIEEQV